MRLIPALLLSVALATAAAGCFGKDEPPANTTPTPSMTPTSPTGGKTDTTPTAPTTGGNTTPTPTKPAPKEVFSGSASFSGTPDASTAPNLQPAPQNNAMPVDVGYTTLTLNVTWASSAPQGAGVVGVALKIQIQDPAGAPLGAGCSAPQGPSPAPPAACTETITIPATGGAYNVQYTGSGTFTATVSVVAS